MVLNAPIPSPRNSVNLATAWHRLAKFSRNETQGEQPERDLRAGGLGSSGSLSSSLSLSLLFFTHSFVCFFSVLPFTLASFVVLSTCFGVVVCCCRW